MLQKIFKSCESFFVFCVTFSLVFFVGLFNFVMYNLQNHDILGSLATAAMFITVTSNWAF